MARSLFSIDENKAYLMHQLGNSAGLEIRAFA